MMDGFFVGSWHWRYCENDRCEFVLNSSFSFLLLSSFSKKERKENKRENRTHPMK